MNPARTRPVLTALNAAPGLLLLLVLAAFTAATPRFLEPRNLVNILVQSSSTGIVAVGMTFVFCCCALAELLAKLGSDTPGAVTWPVTVGVD